MSFYRDGSIRQVAIVDRPQMPQIKPSDLDKLDEDILFWSAAS